MARANKTERFIEAMAKHLPPSASGLRLLDVGGKVSEVFTCLRADLEIVTVEGSAGAWPLKINSVDAVAAYSYRLNKTFLQIVLDALRPGGRLILVNPRGSVDEELVTTLENTGYTRILVEAALDEEHGGVLMRGEKPHTTTSAHERVRQISQRDDVTDLRKPFVHLLVTQTPNLPEWKLELDQAVAWEAAAFMADEEPDPVLLVFSSLPKAVNFMQAAVIEGIIEDVNKMPKFAMEKVKNWPHPILLNPLPDVPEGYHIGRVPVDPQEAETPDE